MRTKNSEIIIDELCEEIKSKLPQLDELMKRYSGTELVITSGNDGIHSGSKWPKSIYFDEKTARLKSDSLHYKNAAIDCRIWGIKSKGKEIQKRFAGDSLILFPKPWFTIIIESSCLHIQCNKYRGKKNE